MKPEQTFFDLSEPEPAPLGPDLMDQIRRDLKVLTEDPIYHVPSAEFYQQRIADNRLYLQRTSA